MSKPDKTPKTTPAPKQSTRAALGQDYIPAESPEGRAALARFADRVRGKEAAHNTGGNRNGGGSGGNRNGGGSGGGN